jgi:hypothetical protein
LQRGRQHLQVEDWIEAGSAISARLAFHLGPAVSCRLDGATASLSWTVDSRCFSGTLALPSELRWTMHRGDADAGWYSEGFARRLPAVTLIGSGRLDPRLHIVSDLGFVEAAERHQHQVTGNTLSPEEA